MKKIIIVGKVHPEIKNDFKKIAEARGTTTSELLERVLRSFNKKQKQKGVIK